MNQAQIAAELQMLTRSRQLSTFCRKSGLPRRTLIRLLEPGYVAQVGTLIRVELELKKFKRRPAAMKAKA